MPYVDGFIVPVPKKKVARLSPPGAARPARSGRSTAPSAFTNMSPTTSRRASGRHFPRSVKLKPSETVMFSWIVYKSRKDRDRVNAKVMKDKRFANMDMSSMPFDAKRMIYGGFKKLVEL